MAKPFAALFMLGMSQPLPIVLFVMEEPVRFTTYPPMTGYEALPRLCDSFVKRQAMILKAR